MTRNETGEKPENMKETRTVGIIAAMQVEIDGIASALTDAKTVSFSGIGYVCGMYGKTRVIAAKSGVGKVFAAICAQTMILEFQPDCVINTGVAGGLCDGLSMLDIVVAESVVQHDMDTSPLGDPVGMISGINIVNIPCDAAVARSLCDSVRAVGVKCVSGVVASGDTFVADSETKKRLKTVFGASACEMEGAAVGQVCYVNRVPFGVIRAISDGGNDDAHLDFPAFCEKAAENSTRSVLKFLEG